MPFLKISHDLESSPSNGNLVSIHGRESGWVGYQIMVKDFE
jgi:hypothetical protein